MRTTQVPDMLSCIKGIQIPTMKMNACVLTLCSNCMQVGWLSGTTADSGAAATGLTDTTYAGCSCKASYSAGGSNFKVQHM